MKTLSIRDYLEAVGRDWRSGDATEHTYRPALKTLLESWASDLRASNDPRRVACGAPDFIVTRSALPVGHIETKDIGKSLDQAAASEQLLRYRGALANLILTDYLEFRWYVAGEPRLVARLAEPAAEGKLAILPDGEAQLAALLAAFLNAPAHRIADAQELARRMALLTRMLRETIALAVDAETGDGALRQQLEGFKRVLLHDLDSARFADMYAQTVAYGLFTARCTRPTAGKFTRQDAAYALPKTNPFLRWLFAHLAGPELDERLAWLVDALAELLDRADVGAILAGFGRGTGREDPVFHFYESFLAAYDTKLRTSRGVYYTPEAVVSYIVRSVDAVLKSGFDLPAGLADSASVKSGRKGAAATHRVLNLDPAVGTGTFLHAVVAHLHRGFAGNEGAWSGYVSRHLLPRLFGFELLMAPYTVAHLKLGMQLEATGYDFQSDERLRVYLTNTLEEGHAAIGLPLFTQHLANEANAAAEVKRSKPVMVILGNPPYAGNSANKGAWIQGLLHGVDTLGNEPTGNYFEVDGEPLGERNAKWLNDDYVKFIRFAQWRIEQTGYGVLAFITNNGYLENPTFRGMRQSLCASFDEIYLLNLHGDSKKRERSPDGSADENVFDITQGVAIGIFVKSAAARPPSPTVHYADLWGKREGAEGKYHWLGNHDLTTTPWRQVRPRSPEYLFTPQVTPQATARLREYQAGWAITDAMPVHVLGFQSHRDDFAIAFSREELEVRIQTLASGTTTDEELARRYGLRDSSEWNLSEARRAARALERRRAPILGCLYRPLDRRWCYYSPILMDRPRAELMAHVAGKANLCLNTVRQTRRGEWRHAVVSDTPAPAVFVEMKDGSNLFPLYLYDTSNNGHLFYEVEREVAEANFAPAFLAAVSAATGLAFSPTPGRRRTFSPEQLFAYIYAVFNASGFAERYAALLKRDFPRVPLTRDAALFLRLSRLGQTLMDQHLLRAGGAAARFPVQGRNEVTRISYRASAADQPGPATGEVWINETQYFSGVEENTWNQQVGGYQVAAQWLKDRKGRALSYEELTAYPVILGALGASARTRAAIDAAIPRWPLP